LTVTVQEAARDVETAYRAVTGRSIIDTAVDKTQTRTHTTASAATAATAATATTAAAATPTAATATAMEVSRYFDNLRDEISIRESAVMEELRVMREHPAVMLIAAYDSASLLASRAYSLGFQIRQELERHPQQHPHLLLQLEGRFSEGVTALQQAVAQADFTALPAIPSVVFSRSLSDVDTFKQILSRVKCAQALTAGPPQQHRNMTNPTSSGVGADAVGTSHGVRAQQHHTSTYVSLFTS
jgi:hypothetical protein